MTTPNKCEFCDKRGLPILLVRDAVAPAGAGAPLAPSLPIELSPRAAHYTKRLLRSGYVNVFDEARRRWEAYFVTDDGYFFRLLQTPGAVPVVPSKPFNCPDKGHRAVASCITVPDPVNASKIWIGFSDVIWTEAVRKLHDDPAYRERHMVEIDVKAALSGQQYPHRPIAQISAVVAEYAMVPNLIKANFSWAPFNFAIRHDAADRLQHECNALRPGSALIVTLPDPAGIAQELACLMRRNAELFLECRPEDKRNLTASLAIDSIEEAIRTQSEHKEIAASEKNANDQEKTNPIGHLLSQTTRERTAAMRDIKQAQLKSSAERQWKKYTEKFDNTARLAWHGPFSKKLEAFDAVFISPLAINHVAWMESADLENYLECNFDPHDPESGAVYTDLITRCIAGTEDKRVCAQLYEKWLEAEFIETNILLRAMLLNQDVNTKAVKEAAKGKLDFRQIPWDNVFSVFTGVIERLNQQTQNAVARLAVQISGSIARMFGKVMDGSTKFRAAFIATGLISGHPIVMCDLTGSRGQFRAHLVRELLRKSGQSISSGQMRRVVNAELRRLQIHGVPLEGTTAKRWVVIADEEMIARMPIGLSPQKRAEWLAGCLKRVEDLDGLNLERWRVVINGKVRSGVVAGILQAICLTKLYDDEKKSLLNNKSDAAGRVYAGLGTIAATTSEAIGNAVAGRATTLRFGQGLATTAAKFLKVIGAGGGLVVGLYAAFLDIEQGKAEFQEGNKGMAMLYYLSAGVGGALAVAMLISSVGLLTGALMLPIIGLLVLAVIAIALLIEFLKDNPIQDWLERCPWGKLTSQRYPDLKTLQEQLNLALK